MSRLTTTSAVALLAGITLLTAACGDAEELDRSQATDTPAAVTVQAALGSNMPRDSRYSGTVSGIRRVPLSTKILGRVTALLVDEGDKINKGDVLLRIDATDIRARRDQTVAHLQEARAHARNARADLKRFERLIEEGSATQKEFDDVQTAYESTRARVASLEGKLAQVEDLLTHATINAPVDAYVVEKLTETGAMASPGQPLLVVETVDDLEVIAAVPERDINRFTPGEEARVYIDAVGRSFSGIVTEINPSGSTPSRQYRVRVRLTGSTSPSGAVTDSVKPGMYAEVLIQHGSTRVTTVPVDAIVKRGQLTGLFTVTPENRAILRWVRLGRTTDGAVEVLSGLSSGEQYVTSSDVPLRDGQAVSVRNAENR